MDEDVCTCDDGTEGAGLFFHIGGVWTEVLAICSSFFLIFLVFSFFFFFFSLFPFLSIEKKLNLIFDFLFI